MTLEQQTFVQSAIRDGRYGSAEDAVRDALLRWEAEERSRAELMASLDEAEADLEAGRFTDHNETTLPRLLEELKHEGAALLTAVGRSRS